MNKPIDTACIIDDDKTYVFLMKRVIQMKKLCERVLIYENGRIAFDELKLTLENKEDDFPEVLLVDINMPEMDGWEFLDQFTKIKPKINKPITIYMVSSSVDDKDIQRAKSYEMVSEYIVKPVKFDALQTIFGVSSEN